MRRVTLGLWLALGALCVPDSRAEAQAAPAADELVPLAQAIVAEPNDPERYDAYAQAAFRARRYEEAIAQLKAGVARIPSYHAGWYKLGYAYRNTRAFAEAAAAYRRHAELAPGKSDTYFGLGAALQGAGDRAGALAAYRRYVELEKAPEKQKFVDQAKAEIVKLDVEPARPALVAPPAQSAYPPAVAAPPTGSYPPPPIIAPPRADAIGLRAAAEKHRQSGKLDEAAAAYERALAADAGNLDLYVELGDVYFAQKRYADAVRIFRLSTERDRGYALGWYDLAHAEARLGNHPAAVTAYREYIKLRPADPDPYYGLAMTYKAMQDSRSAIEAFRTYLKMEKRPEVQRWVDRARRELEALQAGPHTRRADDLKDPFADYKGPLGDRPVYASIDDLPPSSDEARRAHERIERELAADDILPIDLDEDARRSTRDLKDPFAQDDASRAGNNRDRLARYASALAAYRAVLERQAGELTLLYQRGAERVLANDLRGATRAWSAAAPVDRGLEDARARLEKARAALLK